MSPAEEAISGPPNDDDVGRPLDRAFRSNAPWRPRKRKTIDLDSKPHHDRPVDVDPRTLYDQEIERDTRTVRMDVSFADIIKVRDQAQVIREAMAEIIAIANRKDYDDITARRWARRQAAALARTLARMNGKTPRKPAG